MPDAAPFDPQSAITNAATQYGVDPALAVAISQQGEGFGHFPTMDATSPKGAHGIMQLMPDTAKGLGGDFNDPSQNVDMGVRYLKQLQDQFGADHPDLIAAAYNAGPHSIHNGQIPNIPETQAYVQRVTGALGPPSLADVQKAMAGAGGGAAPAADANAPPSLDDVSKAMGLGAGGQAPGTFTITPHNENGQWVYRGPDQKAYTRDPRQSDLFTDPQGNQYQVQGVPEPPPSVQGSVKALASGVLGGVTQGANITNPSALIGQGIDFGTQLATDIANRTGMISPAQQAAFNQRELSLRQAALGATPGEQQSALGLTYQPRNWEERALNIVGGALPFGPAGWGLTATGAAGAFGGSELARAAGLRPEEQELAGMIGGGIGGLRPRLPGVVEPFAAAVVPGAAETQAARIFGGAVGKEGPAVRSALENVTPNVPGSKQTTLQAVQNPNIAVLEKGARATETYAPQFAKREGEQNAARVTAMQKLAPEGSPMALAQHSADYLAGVDADTQSAVDAARTSAQASGAAIGGTATPEVHGAQLRDAITTAEQNARQREGKLWQAIDPDGKLTGNTTASKTALAEIEASQPPTAAPISARERQIYDAAAAMPDVAPARDLVALKQNIRDAMSQELATNGRTPVYARLTQAMNAVQRNLTTTIGDSVQMGLTPAARLQEALADAQRQGQAVSFGGGGAGNAGARGRAGPAPVAGVGGTGVPPPGGPGGAAGAEGVQEPTFDAAAQSRLAAANQATRERATTFGVKPVTDVTATTGMQGQFRLPDGSVPGRFFKPGPEGFSGVQRAIKAGGPQAQGVLEDYAASTLRREAMTPDGTVDPAKFARWQAKYGDALRGLPAESQLRFRNAAEAGAALDEATAARKVAMDTAQKTAAAKVAGLHDPDAVTRRVGQIMEGTTGTADMRSLAAGAGNPDAMMGLKKAVADYVSSKVMSANAEDPTLHAAMLQRFMAKNQAALSEVFSPEEMANLNGVVKDVAQAQAAQSVIKTPGSPTGLNISAGRRFEPPKPNRVLDILGGFVGSGIGSQLHQIPFGQELGGIVGTGLTEGLQRLHNLGVKNVNDVLVDALLNPEVAKRLLAKAPNANGVNGLVRAIAQGAWQGARTVPPLEPKRSQPANALSGLILGRAF